MNIIEKQLDLFNKNNNEKEYLEIFYNKSFNNSFIHND